MEVKYKIVLYLLFAGSVLAAMGMIFWKEEYKFTLPTPKPVGLVELNQGDSIKDEHLPFELGDKTYIHFYNYDCPCSRFNIKEFQSLVKRFSNDIKFVAVIHSESPDFNEIEEFKRKYDLGIPTYLDRSGIVSKTLGVYSTPQAVILKNKTIYYKGNYNKARFCLSKNTKFAEQALTALVSDQAAPQFPMVATTAYGCELPSNLKESKSLFTLF